MVKPMFWRVCGWVGVGSLASGFFLYLAVVLAQADPSGAAVAIALAFFALPWWFLWTVGTLLHRSRVHRARIQAAAYQEIVARGPLPTVEPLRDDTAPDPRKFRSGPLGL